MLTLPVTESGSRGFQPSPPRWRASEDSNDDRTSRREFARTVFPYLQNMLRAAEAILGSEDLAWDAVQETLLRIWTRGWLPESPERALVHLTVKSSLHQRRCHSRRNYHEEQAAELRGTCCDEHPLAAFEEEERAQIVREVIRGLTEEHRAVLELYEFHGESYESIAGRLDLPVGTVRSRLSRGRALVRKRLLAEFDAA